LDGRQVAVEIAGSRVEWLGQPAVQAILRDISEHKRIEQELQSARAQLLGINAGLEQTVRERTAELEEAVEDLRRFSYAIVHDMRAPLRAMHSFATLMQAECAGCESPQNVLFLERIRAAAERLDRLILDAMNYSRVLEERPRLVPLDLGELLRGIIHSSASLQPAVADICLEDPLPPVLGSKLALTQCFSNLLGNAVKFVAPGVRPRVRVWAEEMRSAECGVRSAEGGSEHPESGTRNPASPATEHAPRTTQHDSALRTPHSALGTVRVWFEDNGIGIAPEHQGHIFEMFHRLHQQYEGTGIGLAIVQKAIERLGGRVGLESAVGQGSKFWVELRRASSASPGSPADPGLNNPTEGNLHGTAV
jgi:signal transduction histidine kinase